MRFDAIDIPGSSPHLSTIARRHFLNLDFGVYRLLGLLHSVFDSTTLMGFSISIDFEAHLIYSRLDTKTRTLRSELPHYCYPLFADRVY